MQALLEMCDSRGSNVEDQKNASAWYDGCLVWKMNINRFFCCN